MHGRNWSNSACWRKRLSLSKHFLLFSSCCQELGNNHYVLGSVGCLLYWRNGVRQLHSWRDVTTLSVLLHPPLFHCSIIHCFHDGVLSFFRWGFGVTWRQTFAYLELRLTRNRWAIPISINDKQAYLLHWMVFIYQSIFDHPKRGPLQCYVFSLWLQLLAYVLCCQDCLLDPARATDDIDICYWSW